MAWRKGALSCSSAWKHESAERLQHRQSGDQAIARPESGGWLPLMRGVIVVPGKCASGSSLASAGAQPGPKPDNNPDGKQRQGEQEPSDRRDRPTDRHWQGPESMQNRDARPDQQGCHQGESTESSHKVRHGRESAQVIEPCYGTTHATEYCQAGCEAEEAHYTQGPRQAGRPTSCPSTSSCGRREGHTSRCRGRFHLAEWGSHVCTLSP
jgi:hypothetical protein